MGHDATATTVSCCSCWSDVGCFMGSFVSSTLMPKSQSRDPVSSVRSRGRGYGPLGLVDSGRWIGLTAGLELLEIGRWTELTRLAYRILGASRYYLQVTVSDVISPHGSLSHLLGEGGA